MNDLTLSQARRTALEFLPKGTDYRQFTLHTYSILFGTREVRQRDLTPSQLERLRQHYIWAAQQMARK